jgi:hypothetical protein
MENIVFSTHLPVLPTEREGRRDHEKPTQQQRPRPKPVPAPGADEAADGIPPRSPAEHENDAHPHINIMA